jgi:hypothetical protein
MNHSKSIAFIPHIAHIIDLMSFSSSFGDPCWASISPAFAPLESGDLFQGRVRDGCGPRDLGKAFCCADLRGVDLITSMFELDFEDRTPKPYSYHAWCAW